MIVKLLEIRDRATTVPVMATRLTARNEQEMFLLRRAGYSREQVLPESEDEPYVILTKLDGVQAEYDPYHWLGRTMHVAHLFIIQNWNSLSSGDVVDVEFILGETLAPKRSERVKYGEYPA